MCLSTIGAPTDACAHRDSACWLVCAVGGRASRAAPDPGLARMSAEAYGFRGHMRSMRGMMSQGLAAASQAQGDRREEAAASLVAEEVRDRDTRQVPAPSGDAAYDRRFERALHKVEVDQPTFDDADDDETHNRQGDRDGQGPRHGQEESGDHRKGADDVGMPVVSASGSCIVHGSMDKPSSFSTMVLPCRIVDNAVACRRFGRHPPG